jgi:hypothetical protein
MIKASGQKKELFPKFRSRKLSCKAFAALSEQGIRTKARATQPQNNLLDHCQQH